VFKRYVRPAFGQFRGLIPACVLLASVFLSTEALALALKSKKDSLFALPQVLSQSSDGSFIVVDYQEMRDINGRDQIPERRVKRNYVDLSVRRKSRMRVIEAVGRRIEIGEAGSFENARFAVIFIHGRAGDRRLGMDDFRFGGNFNRIKNLAADNGGVYIAPTVREFGPSGVADVEAIVESFLAANPGAPVIMACGSIGSLVCLSMARDSGAASNLAGMILLGGMPDPELPATPLVKAGVPLTFVHGSNDSVYGWERQKAVFDTIRKRRPNYPARFVLLNTGSHGSPVRMIDWKATLEAMLAGY
jgi:hypothetical protein